MASSDLPDIHARFSSGAVAPDRELLNDSQRRHISVSLAFITRELRDLLAEPRGQEAGDPLTHPRKDLSPAEEKLLEAEVAAICRGVEDLAERFDLEHFEHSRRSQATAVLSAAWTRLIDSQSRGLRGYGDVDPRLQARLDPLLADLVERVERLRQELLGEKQARENR